jgi:hypothetical protein
LVEDSDMSLLDLVKLVDGARRVLTQAVQVVTDAAVWLGERLREWIRQGPRLLTQARQAWTRMVDAVDQEIERGARRWLPAADRDLLPDAKSEGWILFMESIYAGEAIRPFKAGSLGATRALDGFDRRAQVRGARAIFLSYEPELDDGLEESFSFSFGSMRSRRRRSSFSER